MSDHTAIFEKADTATLDHIRKETDAYLGAQLTVALASNQRAMTFFGFLATASAVVGSASITALVTKPELVYFAYTGILTVSGFLAAMLCANKASMPDDFYYVGNTPSEWIVDIKENKSLDKSKAESLSHDADNIAKNKSTIDTAANYMKFAVWLAWISVIVGMSGSGIALISQKHETPKLAAMASCAAVSDAISVHPLSEFDDR